jgi:hypothetical protein
MHQIKVQIVSFRVICIEPSLDFLFAQCQEFEILKITIGYIIEDDLHTAASNEEFMRPSELLQVSVFPFSEKGNLLR